MDLIKPLKIESSQTGGTEDDIFPTECDPSEDYIAAKGIIFENENTYIDKDSDGIKFSDLNGNDQYLKDLSTKSFAIAMAIIF